MTEAAAAKEAGLSTIIVVRDGNAALTDEEKLTYTTVESFLDLTFQASTKRQKLETTDEKIDECTTNVCEPMDTSEDVDMSGRDVGQSSPRVEENVTKEAIESEGKECADGQSSKDVSSSLAQKEESVTAEKDFSKIEEQTLVSEVAELNGANGVKSKETNKNPESVEQTTKDDNATMLIAKDNDKIAVPEKTKENFDTITTEITPTADDSIKVPVPESASKSENSAATSSEKKTEDSTDLAKDMQIDVADNVEAVATDKEANEHETQTCEKSMADVPEESSKMEKDEVKEESKIVPDTSESENVSTKSEPEEVAKPQTSAADPAENGETVGTAGSEKSPVTEMETAANTTDVLKDDVTSPITPKVSAEKSSDTNEQVEKTDEKTTEETKVGETISADAEERDNESTKQETAKEKGTVKEEDVMDTKDKNTVDSEKQKLNGTTQNGDTDVPVLDDKLHSNGLNEGSSKETTAEDTAAQNGEPESSSENSAESIKVKKVVDSTVADGAGEPDVVPPVVVAATS
jgi:enolase-phosphatase E1